MCRLNDVMAHNPMMAKPMKTLKFHYLMIQWLIVLHVVTERTKLD